MIQQLMKIRIHLNLESPAKSTSLNTLLQYLHLPIIRVHWAPFPIHLIGQQNIVEIAILVKREVLVVMIHHSGKLHKVLGDVGFVPLAELGEEVDLGWVGASEEVVHERLELLEILWPNDLKQCLEVVQLHCLLPQDLDLIKSEELHFCVILIQELLNMVEEDDLADSVSIVLLEDQAARPLIQLGVKEVLFVRVHGSLEDE